MDKRITHGLSKSRVYNIWKSMHDRCYRKSHMHYNRYGGRGIIVCEQWHSFEIFLAEMGMPPSTKHSIDRYPNKNGIYEPNNCRWATVKEQAINRDSTIYLTARGKTLCIKEWAELTNTNYSTIRQRHVKGYSHEECIFGIKKENRFTWKQTRVLHIKSGNMYFSGKQAAKALGYSVSHVGKILSGERPDTIGLKYISRHDYSRKLKQLHK